MFTHDRAVTAQVYTAANVQDPAWAEAFSSGPCGGMGLQGGKWVCTDITGSAMDGLQLNFSISEDGAGGTEFEGQAGPEVARLAYVPVQGAKPVDVPLWPELPVPKPRQTCPTP